MEELEVVLASLSFVVTEALAFSDTRSRRGSYQLNLPWTALLL